MRMKLKVLILCISIAVLCISGCGAGNSEDAKNEIAADEEYALEGTAEAAIEEIVENVAKEDILTKVVIEGSIFGGSSERSIETVAVYNPDWITVNDNTVYNSELAKFCSIVCADTYFREKDVEKQTQNRVLYEGENADDYTHTAFLSSLGFTDVQFIETNKTGEYTADIDDCATMLMGYSSIDDEYDIFVIALRGCFSLSEWTSIFDMGGDNPNYFAITGEHSEWNAKEQHKGASIAAVRARQYIDEYISTHRKTDHKTCVLTTGHSRGGAIANLLGAVFEKDESLQAYTYTFNTCGVTTDNKAKEYKTIFNISDSNDFFENVVPFGREKLLRYGTDLQVDILASDDAKKTIAEIKGIDDFTSLSADKKAEYKKMFSERFADRKSLYDLHSTVTKFEKYEDAENYLAECQILIGAEEGLDIEEYCSLSDIATNADGEYEVTLEYCDAALLLGYCKIMVYGDAAYPGVIKLFSNDSEGCRIAEFIKDNLSDIRAGHLILNSYAISDLVKPEI